MKTIIDPSTGYSHRQLIDIKELPTITATKQEAIINYVASHPTPKKENVPNLVLNYKVTIKGVDHTRFYQPATGKSFLDTNYFLPQECWVNYHEFYKHRWSDPDYITYYEMSPYRWNDGNVYFGYLCPIENQNGYRMLELSTIEMSTKKMDKSSNSDIREWKFADPRKCWIMGSGIVPSTRAFMFFGDTNLYDSNGNILYENNEGKFYNKRVNQILRCFRWGDNSNLRVPYYGNSSLFALFALGTDEPTTRDAFKVETWYKNIRPRATSKKTASVNELGTTESNFVNAADIIKSNPFIIDLSKVNSTKDIKLNFGMFENINSDWDVIRVFQRTFDYSSMPEPPKGSKYRTAAYYTTDKERLWYYASMLSTSLSSKQIKISPKSTQEELRILINRNKHESYKFIYDASTKAFKKATSTFYRTGSSSDTEYININDMASNPNLAKTIINFKSILFESDTPGYYSPNVATSLHNIAKSKSFNDFIDSGYINIAELMIRNNGDGLIPSPDRYIKSAFMVNNGVDNASIKASDTPETLMGLSASKITQIEKFIQEKIKKSLPDYRYDIMFSESCHESIFFILTAAYSRDQLNAMSDEKFYNILDTLFTTGCYNYKTHSMDYTAGYGELTKRLLPTFTTMTHWGSSLPAIWESWNKNTITPLAKKYLPRFIEKYSELIKNNSVKEKKAFEAFLAIEKSYGAVSNEDAINKLLACNTKEEIASICSTMGIVI